MLVQLMALLALHTSQTRIVAVGGIPNAVPAEARATPEIIAVRVEAAGAVLWDGTLRIAPNQAASYQQHLNQASAFQCPPDTPHDRSERRQLTVNIYANQTPQQGRSYRVDASWQRPIPQQACLEGGTRTVQITQAVSLMPGESKTIEGDAGLRVQLTLGR